MPRGQQVNLNFNYASSGLVCTSIEEEQMKVNRMWPTRRDDLWLFLKKRCLHLGQAQKVVNYCTLWLYTTIQVLCVEEMQILG
jgi:hypothetical protein